MEFKGTKGKWELEIRETRCSINVSDNKAICDVLGYDVSSVTKTEMEANAKLIAASPEMFEMLKDILSGIREDNFMVTENEIEQLLTKITQ
jgi:hypothetical protein